MPIFYVLSGPDIGKTYELQGGAILGRALECDATLRGTSISRKHARLEKDGDTWTLVDLGSRNGLHQGGSRVEQVQLEEGGTFYVGDLEMRFREEAQGVQLLRKEAKPAPAPEPEIEFGEAEETEDALGIAFEGEELFDSPPPAPAPRAPQPATPDGESRPAPAPRTPAQNKQAERMAAAGIRPSAAAIGKVSDGRPVLQFSKPKGSTGFFSNDLGQYPLPVRLAVGAVVILVFAGLFYFAYRSANSLKGRAVGPELDGAYESEE